LNAVSDPAYNSAFGKMLSQPQDGHLRFSATETEAVPHGEPGDGLPVRSGAGGVAAKTVERVRTWGSTTNAALALKEHLSRPAGSYANRPSAWPSPLPHWAVKYRRMDNRLQRMMGKAND
jgi:hypothetical protein